METTRVTTGARRVPNTPAELGDAFRGFEDLGPYCDSCERVGHTFSTCPRRDGRRARRIKFETPAPERVEFRGLDKGREVRVKGLRGKWSFVSARPEPDGGIAVAVCGPNGESRIVIADRIVVKRQRKGAA